MSHLEYCYCGIYVYSSTPPPVERPPSPLPSVYDFTNAANASITTIGANSDTMYDLFQDLYGTEKPYPAEKRERAFELIERAQKEVAKINTHRGVALLMREWFSEAELRPIEERLEDAAFDNSEVAFMLWSLVTGLLCV